MENTPLTLRDDTTLRLMMRPNVKQWGIEQWERGAWQRQQWQEAGDENTKPTMHFSLSSLSLDTIRDRWGTGIYRLVYSRGPGKRRHGESKAFQLFESDDDDDAPLPMEPAPAVPPSSASSPPPKANGNGHGSNGAPIAGLPTGRGAPPIVASRYGDYVGTRDQSPMETFMSMFALMREQMAEQRAHEERRSREFMAMMALREKLIESDAAVKIAQASASASASSSASQHMADTLRAELEHVRELASQAQQAGGGGNAELAALLGEISAALDGLTGDDDEEPDPAMWGALAGLAERVAGPIGDAVAKRIAGGALPEQIQSAVDDAVGD